MYVFPYPSQVNSKIHDLQRLPSSLPPSQANFKIHDLQGLPSSLPPSLTSSFTHKLVSHYPNTPSMFPLHHSLFLDCSFPKYSHSLLPHILQVTPQVSPYERGFPLSPFVNTNFYLPTSTHSIPNAPSPVLFFSIVQTTI